MRENCRQNEKLCSKFILFRRKERMKERKTMWTRSILRLGLIRPLIVGIIIMATIQFNCNGVWILFSLIYFVCSFFALSLAPQNILSLLISSPQFIFFTSLFHCISTLSLTYSHTKFWYDPNKNRANQKTSYKIMSCPLTGVMNE